MNPATIPFYGLRFDATSGYIGRGSSEIFAFNMPANVPIPSSIQVAVKCSDFVYSVNLTTNCTNNYNQHLIAERLDIEAQAEQNWARIEWVSNTGEKNDYFTVEKASTATGEFETLETVNNKVYDNSAAHYVVYDNAPTEGENIYRLKSVFTDGTIKISNTKTLVFKGLNDVRTFPTPVNDVLNIDLSNYRNEAAEVYLYNYFGQQVGYQKVDNVGGGLLEMDVANQPTGNYLVRIQSKGKREVTKKIVISH